MASLGPTLDTDLNGSYKQSSIEESLLSFDYVTTEPCAQSSSFTRYC